MNGTTTERTYISVTDTAKELRKALKEAFPQVKFSVKSKSYSGGASIDMTWTDGPTTHMVEKVAKRFQGATFDGMTDMKNYHDSIHHGQRVHWGADCVFCHRSFSQTVLQHAADRVAKRWGIAEMPAVIIDKWGSPILDQSHPNTFRRHDEHARYDLNDLVHQETYRLYSYNGVIYYEVN